MQILVWALKIGIEQEITEATKDSKFSPSFSLLSPVKISSEFDFKWSTSGIDEETVPKTAAPRKGVQSAILWCSATLNSPRNTLK